MTTSLQSFLSENYQENRDYELEDKILSCFKNEDENALLEIKEYLPIKNEALIIKIVESVPNLTKKIINYKKVNIDLIEWSPIISLVNNNFNMIDFREKLFMFIINDESESFINALKKSNYEYVKFLKDLPDINNFKINIIQNLIIEKNRDFFEFENKSGIVFDRKDLCLKYINQKLKEEDSPRTYEFFKSAAESFNIIKPKELLILWEDSIGIATGENRAIPLQISMMKSIQIHFKNYAQEYMKIKEEIEKIIILEEKNILSEYLNQNLSNTVKNRM